MATKLDVATEIATEFGDKITDVDTREQYLDWVQDGIDEIVAAGRWFHSNTLEALALVASTAEYTLGATVSELLVITLTGGSLTSPKEVVYAPVERLIARNKSLTAEGVPDYWYYSGVTTAGVPKIKFQPVPDDSYSGTAHELKQPPVLGDNDAVPFGREFVRVLKELVRYKAAVNEKEYNAAQLFRQVYEQGLSLLNARFMGPARGSDGVRASKIKATDQAPGAADGT